MDDAIEIARKCGVKIWWVLLDFKVQFEKGQTITRII